MIIETIIAASEAPGQTSEIIVAILASTAVSSVVVAVVTGYFSKKRVQGEADKFGADASDIIQKAAAGVVTSIREDNARIREEQTAERIEHIRKTDEIERRAEETVASAERKMDKMATEHEAELEHIRRVLQLHVAWDAMAVAKLAQANIVDLPPAPPLLPPGRRDRGYTEESNTP